MTSHFFSIVFNIQLLSEDAYFLINLRSEPSSDATLLAWMISFPFRTFICVFYEVVSGNPSMHDLTDSHFYEVLILQSNPSPIFNCPKTFPSYKYSIKSMRNQLLKHKLGTFSLNVVGDHVYLPTLSHSSVRMIWFMGLGQNHIILCWVDINLWSVLLIYQFQ
jgi:hypothetical protein